MFKIIESAQLCGNTYKKERDTVWIGGMVI